MKNQKILGPALVFGFLLLLGVCKGPSGNMVALTEPAAAKQETTTTTAARDERSLKESTKDNAGWFSIVMVLAFPGLLLTGMCVGAGVLLVQKVRYVEPDPVSGTLPVPTRAAKEMAAGQLRAFNARAAAEASHPFKNLTHLNAREQAVAELAAGPPAEKELVSPTFMELREAKKLEPGAVPIAWTPKGLLQGPPKKLKSAGIVGMSGCGKSNLLTVMTAWPLLNDYAVFVGDLHAHLDESTSVRLGDLKQHLYRPVAGDKEDLLDMMKYLRAAWEDIAAGRPHELSGRRVLVVLDELTGVAARNGLVEPMGELVRAVAQEGRKAEWMAVVAGHQATKAAMGGGKVVDSLVMKVSMQLAKQEAARWLDVTTAAMPTDTKHLDPGECYIMQRSGLLHARVPWLPEDAVREIAAELDAKKGMKVAGTRLIEPDALMTSQPEALVTTQPVQITAPSPLALVEDVDDTPTESLEQKILRLKLGGMSNIQIVRECWGVDAAKGNAYQNKFGPLVDEVIVNALRTRSN